MTIPNQDGRFDLTCPDGSEAERFVRFLFDKGLSSPTIEVKHDKISPQTGNLFVEYECQYPAPIGWRPSGIAVSEADLWVCVLGTTCFAWVLETDFLWALSYPKWTSGDIKLGDPSGSHPTRGVVLPLRYIFSELRSVEMRKIRAGVTWRVPMGEF